MKIQFILLLLAALQLTACVNVEPRSTAPHVNLSPDVVFANTEMENLPTLDFGLEVTANESDSLENLTALPGVRVRNVAANGAAAAAQIKAGDVILAVNNTDTNHTDTFATLLQMSQAGSPQTLTVRRDTTVFDTDIVGRTRTQANIRERYRIDPTKARAGFITQPLENGQNQTTGAQIVAFMSDSPLLKAGLLKNDILTGVNNQPIESAQDLVNKLHGFDFGETILVDTIRAGEAQQPLTIRLWDPGTRISRLSLWPLFTYESTLEPSGTHFSILDFWLVSLFKYEREDNEKVYQLLTLFKFGTGAGELVDEDTN